MLLPFNYWNLKKGRVISFFNGGFTDKNRRAIKEWKKELNIVIKKEYKEFTPYNIEYVLKWYEIEKAIQYLKQQGIDRIWIIAALPNFGNSAVLDVKRLNVLFKNYWHYSKYIV